MMMTNHPGRNRQACAKKVADRGVEFTDAAYSDPMIKIGMVFPPNQPPERLRDVAIASDKSGIDELWLWEDCFAESGVATASAVLAWTDRLHVGIGLMPVPLRNVALTAMEVATLARLFPSRLLPGIGHGVLPWMGQVGARVSSPLTLLREYATALGSLLNGQSVTVRGDYVHLDGVRLTHPPESVPPLLIGATRPKTLALAGELGDGVLFGGGEETPDDVRAGIRTALEARTAAGVEAPFDIVTTAMVRVTASVDQIEEQVQAYAAAGVTRLPICGTDADGSPAGGDAIMGLVEAVAQVRGRLR